MKTWLRGRWLALIVFLAITALVTGGLGWVTAAALRLEREQIDARAEAEQVAQLRPALWQLDSRISPILAREDSRPYSHYSTVYAPPFLLGNDGTAIQPGRVLEPSPLVNEDLPPWMLLHFQTDTEQGWSSPQVLSQKLNKILTNPKFKAPLDNVTDDREQLRLKLAGSCNPIDLVQCVKQRSEQRRIQETTLLPDQNANPANYAAQTLNNDDQVQKGAPNAIPQQSGQGGQNFSRTGKFNDFANRVYQQDLSKKEMQGKEQVDDAQLAFNNLRNGETWFAKNPMKPTPSQKTAIKVGAMVPLWLAAEDQENTLLVARLVQIGDRQICQGIVLDWNKLQELLKEVAQDTFPEARFQPQREPLPAHPERTMTALPVEMDPGPLPQPAVETWTPLRIGLAMAWAAALVALSAVGLGGSSLIDLSERRIRFVSAVTHELRTPLTTLRLYLDMLAGGLVKDEARQAEYLQTLHGETDRLHRLVGNVLDFSRLENQRPRLEKTTVKVAELLDQVRANWQGRCQSMDKELVVENPLATEVCLHTDVNLVQQILGNLIDNACKYSKGAEDKRISLRVGADGTSRLVVEVEDRGPGVPVTERRSIFRPFRRGGTADVTAGGVGLGLALARQWAQLLGGKLVLATCSSGACFRLELPRS
jgi:signal transduction histidine kinase